MKKRLLNFMRTSLSVLSIAAVAMGSQLASAQCPFPNNPFGSGTAPTTVGSSVTLSSCVFAGEHSTLNSATVGHTYQVTSSGGSYFTVYLTTNTTSPVAFGNGPLTFVAPVSGNYFIVTNTNSACGTATVCLTIAVSLISTGPCVAPPSAGVASAPASACPGNLTLTLTGASTGSGLVIQWQSSVDDVTFTDIPGATGTSVSVQHPTPSYYRAVSTCDGQSATSNSVFVTVNDYLSCYCTPTVSFDTWGYINRFKIGDFENISPTACGQTVSTFPGTATTLFKTLNYDVEIDLNNCSSGTYDYGTRIWIDFNKNGAFEANELVYGPNTLTPVAANVVTPLTTNITIPATAETGLVMMRVATQEDGIPSACGSWSWGEVENYFVLIAPQPANDAGITEITNPTAPTCDFSGPVRVNLVNQGTEELTSVTFNVQLNGFTLPSVAWTGNLASGAEIEVTIGQLSFNDGDNIKIWVSNPNGVADEFVNNDTIQAQLFLALEGSYTLGGTNPDFANFAAVTQAFQQRGVCGNVEINVRNGEYNEQVVLTPLNYVGAGGTVWFQAESGNPDDVILSFSSTTSANNGVVLYRGADNVGFRSMTLRANSSSFQRVVHIRNGSHNVSLERLVIEGDPLVFFDDFEKVLVLSDGDVDNNTVISNSEFKGGSRSISLGGVDVNQLEAGSSITGNTFEGFFTGAILLFNQINPTVSENTIVGETGNFNAPFFIYLNGTKLGATVNANYIYANEYGFGINLDNANGASSTPIVVSNNILNFKNNDATGTQFALFTQNGTSEANIVNNSVLIKSELGTNAAVRLGGTGNNFWNNNIVSEGAAYAVLATNANTVAASNFNNLFSPVGNFSAVGSTNFADAAAWNAATGLDGNSVSVDPEFADSLLTSCAPELDNAAFPLPFVSTDFVGNVRSTSTPDIGAYEFLASNNLGLQEAYSFCPENIQPIGVDAQTGVTYSWNPGNSTESTTIPSGAGTYTLTATSACGSFSQSTEVELLPLPNASFTFTTYFLTAVFTNTSTGGTSYLWNFGDGNTSTEVNPTHLYDATGTFDVTLTVFNECGSVVSSDKVTTATVGIEDMDANSFNVYPNPSNGVFNINLDVNGISDLLIDVIDLSGRVIYSQFIANAVEASILTINIEGVKPGVYNVRLNSADFNVVRKLIIK